METSVTSNTMTYRVHTAVLAILNLDGERVPVTIPANSHIHLKEFPSDSSGNTLIDVVWQGRALMMFARDVQARAYIVQVAGGC
jgi:hypothetical protein